MSLEDDLCCTICRDIFKDPVVLSCSHSYCRVCLRGWWNGKKRLECPVCKSQSQTSEPPSNQVLRKVCEAILERQKSKVSKEKDTLCAQHSEKLKLFCFDHQQPLCLICLHSDVHEGHKIRPIEEVAGQQKKELRDFLKPLKEKLNLYKEARENYSQTAEHVKVQAERTEALIREQFKKIQEFLQTEEEVRIKALREEEQKKCKMMRNKVEILTKKMDALSQTIRATEIVLKREEASFLQSYASAVQQVKQSPLLDDPQPASGALIDEAKHRGNLIFKVWKKMKTMVHYTPVVLDPNTANAELSLSEDLMTVSCGPRQNIPDNPERFDCFRIVLGSKGLKSGTHSWDVEIGHNTNWFVGLASEGVLRKGKHPSCLWRIGCIDSKYTARSLSDPSTLLPWTTELHRVRVVLDWDRGELVFYDLDTNTHIYTFMHQFTEKLFPYFNTASEQPMTILPKTLCIGKGLSSGDKALPSFPPLT